MVYLIPDLPKVTENKQTYHQINKKKNKISIGHFTIRGHGVILLLLPESYSVLICFLAQIILGLLLIKPRWDFQIYFSVNLYWKKKGNEKKKRRHHANGILFAYDKIEHLTLHYFFNPNN